MDYHCINRANNSVRTYNDRAFKIAMQSNPVPYACMLPTSFYCSPSEGRGPIANYQHGNCSLSFVG